jgi:hypothetical protein
MRWMKRTGLALAGASLAVAVGVAANQLLTGDERLSWTAAYFVLIFTVLGVLLAQVPGNGDNRKGKPSRHRYLRRMHASVEQMETIGLVTQAEYVLRTRLRSARKSGSLIVLKSSSRGPLPVLVAYLPIMPFRPYPFQY